MGGLSSRMKYSGCFKLDVLSDGFKNMVASRPSAKELMEHDFFKISPPPAYFTNSIGIVGWELDEKRFELNVERAGTTKVGRAEVELFQKVQRKNMEFQKMKRKLEATLGSAEVELLHKVLRKNMEFDEIKRKLEMKKTKKLEV